ncbi:MAG: mechanosensitive ion channel domain-containing protein [Pseudomonadota bacterium]
MKRLLPLIIALLITWPAWAGPLEDNVARWSLELAEIEARHSSHEPTISELEDHRRILDMMSTELRDGIIEREQQLAPVQAGLEQLGAPPAEGETEDARLAEERTRLSNRAAALSGGLRLAQNLKLNVDDMLTRVIATQRQMFRQELRTRSRGVLDAGILNRAWEAVTRKIDQFRVEIRTRLAASDVTWVDRARRALGFFAVIGLLVLLFRIKGNVISWLKSGLDPEDHQRRNAKISICLTLVRLILPTTAIALFYVWFSSAVFIGPLGLAIVKGAAYSLLLVVAAYGLGSAFFAPYEPALRISRLENRKARSLHFWMICLALIVGLDRLFVEHGADSLGLSFETLVVVNTLLLVPGGLALWLSARVLAHTPPPRIVTEEDQEEEGGNAGFLPVVIKGLWLFVRIAAVAAPILAIVGYYAASRFLFYSVVFSGATLSIGVMLFHAVHETVEQAVQGDEVKTRRNLQLIPILVAFMMICIAIPVLALIWGASWQDITDWAETIGDGFQVGEIVISPLDLFSFLIVFSIGYVVTRMIQGVLSRNVLPLTGLDSGGRDALTAGIGYVGIFVAALIAISTTGLDLSNVAIVAGALSVGIGFGLQNIVNNFISGIILLVERPIKAGDWVELASGMGYVRKVNVRSTEVQTFDRSTLFVPNSELIASSVINWTHSDLNGRLIVPIGVAYGTEPRKVEKILQEIADSHPMLLKRPSPYVLFRGFGADSLNFEIRGVLRDVNWILNVQSDMNYAIAEKFEQAGIEIPFAQRDIHIKNIDELGKGISSIGRPKLETEEPEEALPPPKPTRKAGMDTGDGESDGVD